MLCKSLNNIQNTANTLYSDSDPCYALGSILNTDRYSYSHANCDYLIKIKRLKF